MEKRGGRKTSRMTPLPKRGFGPPLVWYVFHPPQVSALFFLYKNPRQSGPKALLEGSKDFRESAFSGTFPPPPLRFAPPHITAQVAGNDALSVPMPFATKKGPPLLPVAEGRLQFKKLLAIAAANAVVHSGVRAHLSLSAIPPAIYRSASAMLSECFLWDSQKVKVFPRVPGKLEVPQGGLPRVLCLGKE